MRTPGTPGIKFRLHIVNKYQSLTIALKTPIPGVTGHVDPLLNLIVTIKKNIFDLVICNQFVGGKFYKVCKGRFQESDF